MKDLLEGFVSGVKETPRAFFAPVVAIWRVLLETTKELISSGKGEKRVR